MASTLSPSNLKITSAYGESGWAATYNDNWTLINNALGKLSGLIDVQVAAIANNHVLRWNSGTSKFVNVAAPKPISFITTTTTTTTTAP